jgi:hypothetical protein
MVETDVAHPHLDGWPTFSLAAACVHQVKSKDFLELISSGDKSPGDIRRAERARW